MYRFYQYRYFFGLCAVIILLILIISLIVSNGPKTTKTLPASLTSYADSDAQVSMTIDGPVVADQLHQSIEIFVGSTTATFQEIQGYEGNVVNQQTFLNNTSSYTAFLYSLERAGFTEGDKSADLQNDLGYCPLGNRFIFKLTEGDKTLERYWATNCGGTKTYLGNLNLTITLFQNQIPNYSTLISNVNI